MVDNVAFTESLEGASLHRLGISRLGLRPFVHFVKKTSSDRPISAYSLESRVYVGTFVFAIENDRF